MTKAVNTQIDEVTLAVQSLTSLASNLQDAVATFQLSEEVEVPAADERAYALPVPNGLPVGNGHNGHNGNGNGSNGHNGWYN